MMGSVLQGKCALITGSTQGIGWAGARRFAAAGCNIALHGFGVPAATEAARAALEEEHQVRAIYCGADLNHPEQIEAMIRQTEHAFGAIDILVNNAVVRHSAPVEQFPPKKWDEAIAVNLSAAFHTIRLALPGMRSRNWGRIINVSSIYASRGAADRVGYVTTKTALLGLTRAVALEVLGQEITCNAICPGTVPTPAHESTMQTMMTSEGLSRAEAEQRFLAGKQPSGRFIRGEDVAALMLFLCAPESRDINGAALPIDGAWSVR
ncbi:MAG: SDR family oxidoreductase [Acidobacteriia bacterium]|nr:SDR family oxidoreductase [Terriglobia bacterium]